MTTISCDVDCKQNLSGGMDTKGLKVDFEPSGKFPQVDEVFRERNRAVSPVRKGLKRTACESSQEQAEEIARVLTDLRSQLHRPRVERIAARCVGHWDPALKLVRLVRKVGKFREFGHTIDKEEYLRCYEALFLLELNRLKIYFESVLVSIEQAYHLLLGQKRSRDYDKYLVYSTLCRSGYSVQPFTNHSCAPLTSKQCTDVDCIWEILRGKLDASYEVPSKVKSHPRFDALNISIAALVEKTKVPTAESREGASEETLVEFQPRKRSRTLANDNYRNAKRRKVEHAAVSENESFLDCLRNDPAYQRFSEALQELEVVKLQVFEDYDDQHSRDLPMEFDLYLPTKNFKRTGNLRPDFRVLVFSHDDQFPSRSEMVKAYRSQRVAVPLLVASVSLSKHVQLFLYYFT